MINELPIELVFTYEVCVEMHLLDHRRATWRKNELLVMGTFSHQTIGYSLEIKVVFERYKSKSSNVT